MTNDWWKNETAYQIWPKSFMDSNGDGIGDIRGITSKLDYLKDLGIGILWISPFYPSPLADEGYDISDYYGIDPRFGTMEDFDELISEASKRSIHIVIDMVLNHCSDEHPWFRKACEDPDGPYGKYFYIMDREGDRLPSNLRSYFGGPVWEPLPGHPDKVYLHLFHKKQPDLNWENPELRAEIYKMMNWWLDKGVSGFRMDAIINIKKVLPFHDYPADRDDGLASVQQMLTEQTGILDFFREMKREVFDKHDTFTVSELFNYKPEDLPALIGTDGGCFSSIFDFSTELCGKSPDGWYHAKPFLTADEYRESVFNSQKAIGEKGFFSNIIENHDEPRGVSHYIRQDLWGARSKAAKKALAGTYFLLRGIPFIYQGQETGMENISIPSIAQVDDVETLNEYRTALAAGLSEDEALQAVAPFSRDNVRVPMRWTEAPDCGFTTGTPWTPLYASPENNVEDELQDPDSVLNFYKKLIRLRGNEEYWDVLTNGEFLAYNEGQSNIISYFRWNGICTLLIMANFQPECQNIELPDEGKHYEVILTNGAPLHIYGNTATLLGWQFAVVQVR